ncbi:MAG: cupin domain-containing protein [Bacteroidetes bacterium]|nr:cupin domain-containing protein [Bacteroidota bacterium]
MKKQSIKAGDILIDFLLDAPDTNGAATLFEFTVPAGAKVPVPHYHKDFDEAVYGLAGTMTFTVDGKRHDIQPGGTLFIPRGAVHGFDNHGDTDARALAVITPGLLGPNYFKEMAEVLNAGGPPDVAKLKQVMQRHGLVPSVPQAAVARP